MTINALNYQKKNLSRFKKQLDYLYDNNKHYQEKITENDVDLSSIRKITDITKLPLLTKQDLRTRNKMIIDICKKAEWQGQKNKRFKKTIILEEKNEKEKNNNKRKNNRNFKSHIIDNSFNNINSYIG